MAQRPYLNDRLIEEMPGGFVVIVPANAPKPVPLSCPVCDHVLRSRDDATAYEEFACCERCAQTWAHPRRKAWADGWRPSSEQVALAEGDRPPISFTMDVG